MGSNKRSTSDWDSPQVTMRRNAPASILRDQSDVTKLTRLEVDLFTDDELLVECVAEGQVDGTEDQSNTIVD